ncbi:MAG: hypothetical protein KIH67_004590 [Candidatus Moranbacteria bacterium]|nr:hypothetical protein [Candidatus Moranbacteria bacterium]
MDAIRLLILGVGILIFCFVWRALWRSLGKEAIRGRYRARKRRLR